LKTPKTIWQMKQSADPDTLDIYIYESIMPDSYDWWEGEKITSETSANYFKEELEKHPNVKFINLYINSYGGDVKEAMGIHSQLKRHPAYVTGHVDGFAASAASYILTACDKVVMPAPTMQMLHDMWSISIGNAKEHRKEADTLDAIMQGNRQAYLAKANGKLNDEQLKEIMQAETWLTAEQCVEFGLADEISDKVVDMAAAAAALKEVNDNLAARNKQLVAKLRQLTADPPPQPPADPVDPVDPVEPTDPVDPVDLVDPVPEPNPDPDPPKQNKVQNFFAAMIAAEGRE
jgi:ATP-dependent Clp protease protease subunit